MLQIDSLSYNSPEFEFSLELIFEFGFCLDSLDLGFLALEKGGSNVKRINKEYDGLHFKSADV